MPSTIALALTAFADKHEGQQSFFTGLRGSLLNLVGHDNFAIGVHEYPRGEYPSAKLPKGPGFWEAYDWYFRNPVKGGTLAGIVECMNKTTRVAGYGLIVYAAESSVFGIVLGCERITISDDYRNGVDEARWERFVTALVQQSYTAVSHGNLAELVAAKRPPLTS